MIKAAVFDMDGILVDSEPLWRDAMVEAFGEVGLDITREQCAETTGMRIDHVVAYRYNRTPWNGASQEKTVELILDKLVDLIYAQAVPMEGAIDSIQLFKENGLKVGLATSSSNRIIDAILDKLELKDSFEVINSAEFLEYGKPHPEVYIKTAVELGVSPSECVAIEDSFNGLLSAKSATMKTIVVPEPQNRGQQRFCIADIQLESLRQLDHDHLKEIQSLN